MSGCSAAEAAAAVSSLVSSKALPVPCDSLPPLSSFVSSALASSVLFLVSSAFSIPVFADCAPAVSFPCVGAPSSPPPGGSSFAGGMSSSPSAMASNSPEGETGAASPSADCSAADFSFSLELLLESSYSDEELDSPFLSATLGFLTTGSGEDEDEDEEELYAEDDSLLPSNGSSFLKTCCGVGTFRRIEDEVMGE